MVKAKKTGKKVFYDVDNPLTSAKVSLLAYSPEELDGQSVKIDLTRSLRGKSFEFKLKIKNKEGKLVGEPVSLWLAGSYIRRAIRKGIDYVEDSFVIECRDAKVVFKPFLITRHKVSRAVRNELRNTSRKFLEAYIKSRSTEELFTEIMNNKIQKELSLRLKKVYPLALCEIRVFEVVGPKTEVKEEKKEAPEKLEVKEVKEKKVKKAAKKEEAVETAA